MLRSGNGTPRMGKNNLKKETDRSVDFLTCSYLQNVIDFDLCSQGKISL